MLCTVTLNIAELFLLSFVAAVGFEEVGFVKGVEVRRVFFRG